MIEDKERWNIRYKEKPFRDYVEPIIEKYIDLANKGRALDIACGQGRNTHFIAEKGFEVDAVDLSDYALSCVRDEPNIHKIEADLDEYNLEKNKYDLVVNMNYLNRRFYHQIKEALKPDGLVIFETFIIAHGDFDNPQNPEYLLRKNELLHTFISLDIIYYEEHDDINLRGEKTRVASLVAQKRSC
ncbi:class I SAM-dependent methyltransferase [Sulfurimonas paralvinellae]|uniref:Class I SAM-dependent methyltransferase n=1 Tax=Sulfurimonas paralvinellae TaxID=317658 RepID=A0A7M1BAJ4_9BACT|nr:class I SAM-dependent methyltransferase [Sulfurimonas paralvinellae]QOP45772.1 class I SAM-dependent methyltransferase [Sulfurimonas paralvinellae]